jgi:hypothetical protein
MPRVAPSSSVPGETLTQTASLPAVQEPSRAFPGGPKATNLPGRSAAASLDCAAVVKKARLPGEQPVPVTGHGRPSPICTSAGVFKLIVAMVLLWHYGIVGLAALHSGGRVLAQEPTTTEVATETPVPGPTPTDLSSTSEDFTVIVSTITFEPDPSEETTAPVVTSEATANATLPVATITSATSSAAAPNSTASFGDLGAYGVSPPVYPSRE